ncbi:MAG: serine protease [Gammaproteobacteria bacterium]|nr:serine protease [Gammaproteobacteria bacterium]
MPRRCFQYYLLFATLIVLVCVDPVVADLPDTIEAIRPGVVGVGTARPVRQPLAKGPPIRFLGTGFVVGNGRQIITNYHVVPAEIDTEHQESLAIFAGRGKNTIVRSANLVRADPEHDLALLEISGDSLPALTLGDGARVREGESIAFTGFPIGVVLGLYPVTHRGIISVITPTVIPAQSSRQLTAAQIRRIRDPFDVYQLDATAYPGNSGSPVYRMDSGIVIGVINSVFIKNTKESALEKPSGISYAIPVRYVLELLDGD